MYLLLRTTTSMSLLLQIRAFSHQYEAFHNITRNCAVLELCQTRKHADTDTDTEDTCRKPHRSKRLHLAASLAVLGIGHGAVGTVEQTSTASFSPLTFVLPAERSKAGGPASPQSGSYAKSVHLAALRACWITICAYLNSHSAPSTRITAATQISSSSGRWAGGLTCTSQCESVWGMRER